MALAGGTRARGWSKGVTSGTVGLENRRVRGEKGGRI